MQILQIVHFCIFSFLKKETYSNCTSSIQLLEPTLMD
nr:MAG TPA: hypothetical protein [Caudoviricetes sp.]